MFLFRQEDECGYNTMECLYISTEKLSRKVDKTRLANSTVSYVARFHHIALSYGVV
jgi:hypothetical protein